MSNIVRHNGVARNTGSRVFVLWREIPDDPSHCLIVYRDSLPEVYANTVSDLVMGKGQASINLWEVMDKIGYLDGKKMLDVLHGLGYIRKLRTSDIDMHVGGNAKVALDILNQSINEQAIQADGKVKDYNPFDGQIQNDSVEKGTIVEKLLNDARQYERLAKETYERAYNLEPSLRPQAHVVEEAPVADTSTFYLEIPEGVSQTKAIELLKKFLQERKVGK